MLIAVHFILGKSRVLHFCCVRDCRGFWTKKIGISEKKLSIMFQENILLSTFRDSHVYAG